MLSVIFALGSAVCWGVSDFLGGIKSRSMALMAVLLISQGVGLAMLSIIVLALGQGAPDARFLVFAAASGLGEIVGVAALYRGLAVGKMSIVAPVASIAPVVPLVVGFALGEVPGPMQVGGLMLILAGLILTAQKRPESPDARAVAPSIFYGLLSALGFGIFFVAMDSASSGGIPWALFVARATALGLLAAVVILARVRIAVKKADLPVTAFIGVLIVAADFLYATATGIGLLSVVAVLGALHTVVTIGLAQIFLRERIGRFQNAGIVVCLCGVLAVAAT